MTGRIEAEIVPPTTSVQKAHNPLDSTHPVLVPYAEELFYDVPSFDRYIRSLKLIPDCKTAAKAAARDVPSNKFMSALKSAEPSLPPNKIYTENMDITNESSGSPLLDLFVQLEQEIDTGRLSKLLADAWKVDADATLKIIWNARSIHVGKSDKNLWYKSMGWLKENHPLTLLKNLEWVVRPVIEIKKGEEEKGGEDEMVVVESGETKEVDAVLKYDVENGGSHGYYRDLGNLLVLAAKGVLNSTDCDKKLLYTERMKPLRRVQKTSRRSRKMDAKVDPYARMKKQKEAARELRHAKEKEAHENVVNKFNNDPFYRALHLTVARVFASQLERDLALLKLANTDDLHNISLAGKWAPSLEHTVDRSTLLATTIAEFLFPPENIGQKDTPRELYLKHARQHYRMALAKLRKALDIVECKITTQEFDKIRYHKVPSLAMSRYTSLFIEKDFAHFERYIADVAQGKSKISGAILLPSRMIMQARKHGDAMAMFESAKTSGKATANQLIKFKQAELESDVLNAQWKSLVQRIRDSGTLDNSIAIVDVSGSMESELRDGTQAIDSAIGLGLLLAHVAKPPFHGTFITFSENPQVVTVPSFEEVGTSKHTSLCAVVREMNCADWGMNTDFTAVFERLLLPMALNNELSNEDMVKRLFVFSDMQFDACGGLDWETSYEKVKHLFKEKGYDLPEMVFWNLDGQGLPVEQNEAGTAMVSGYSQAMLKVFLDNGGFEDPGEEIEDVEVVDEETGEVKVVTKKAPVDPMAVMWKSIGHKSYAMLEVVD